MVFGKKKRKECIIHGQNIWVENFKFLTLKLNIKNFDLDESLSKVLKDPKKQFLLIKPMSINDSTKYFNFS